MTACACTLPAAASGATIKVTTTTDELDGSPDATCSVREAVQSANTNTAVGGCKAGSGAADTITLGKGHYSLSIPTTDEGLNANGDLDVSGGKLTFVGKGSGVTDISTGLNDRIVDIHDGVAVTFEDIQIFSGDVSSLGPGSGRGGNIRADEGGTVTLKNSSVTSGNAYIGGGLYLNGQTTPGKLKITRSTFVTNHATGVGGGLDVAGDVTTKISKSRITENTVTDLDDAAEAAGIANRAGKMTISDTEITDNSANADTNEAAYGGAIGNYTGASLEIKRTLIAGNSASAPTNAIFEAAGGIYFANGSGQSTITNSTFYDNVVGAPDGNGSALHLNGGSTTVNNVTFSANGPFSTVYLSAGYVLLRNSILDGPNPCGTNGGDFIDSGGYNVASVDDVQCDFQSEDVTDALSFGFKTGLLAENGGLTRTLALKKSSPAVNLIPKPMCDIASREDQRGYRRPRNNCDSGAFERKAKKPKKPKR